MKAARVAFAVIGVCLLGLAAMLGWRRDPGHNAEPREAPGAPGSAVGAVSRVPVPMEPPAITSDHEGRSSISGELLHDDPDTLQSTSLWLVGPYRDPGQEPPRVPLPLTDGGFEQNGLVPGEYALEGQCKGRQMKRSFMILANGEQKTLRIDLTAVLPRGIRGRAFLDGKKHPLSNERLTFSLVTWQSFFQEVVTTGNDGSFEMVPGNNTWNVARVFRNAPSAPFVEIENTGSADPVDVIFASVKGRKGLLTTTRKEPLPFTDFILHASARPKLHYFKTSDERGEFPADDIVPGEYDVGATSASGETIAASVTIPETDAARIALPFDEYVIIMAEDPEGRNVSRGYLYHVRCSSLDEECWGIRPFSPTGMGASGSAMAGEDEADGSQRSSSGAAILGLPSTGDCVVEVLSLEHGWGRSTFTLPHAPREVPVRMTAPVEIEIAVSDASGSPVENPVFKFPGFHENAPLLPGGGQRFFDSLSDSLGFNLRPLGEAGKFKVRLAPGSSVCVEAPGRGKVICEADRILKERAVVLE